MTMPVPASYNDLKEGVDFRDHYGWAFYQRTIAVPEVKLNEYLQPGENLLTVAVDNRIDHSALPYGICIVWVDGGKFLINEQPFYFKGYGKHEDTYPAGRGLNMPRKASWSSMRLRR